MSEDQDLTKLRSEVIEKSIAIEWVINSIISQHYLGKPRIDFVSEVLYDEYFTFALKRRILLKICPDLRGDFENKLNRANTIRNYFAHVGSPSLIEGSDPNGPARTPDPRDFSRSVLGCAPRFGPPLVSLQ